MPRFKMQAYSKLTLRKRRQCTGFHFENRAHAPSDAPLRHYSRKKTQKKQHMRVKNTVFSYENISFSLSICLASGSRVEERGFHW
jgi:hypothetical protein